MTELKRPENRYAEALAYHPQTKWNGGGVRVYTALSTDGFLEACASELERARKMKEEAKDLMLDAGSLEDEEKAFQMDCEASQIENEVIAKLKGEKK